MPSTFSRGNPRRAAIYDWICAREERRGLLEWRRTLVGDLDGDVVEIGCGTGLNFPHYAPGARVFASDLDPVMLARAVPRADKASARVQVFVADALALPVADSSVDALVIGLMLCTVPDPVAALAEIRRVLRPGGRLRFLEHVRDEDGTVRARIQDAVNPVWRAVSGGCNANRRTLDTVAEEGFRIDRAYGFKLGVSHVAPHIMAEATVR